MKTKIIFGGFLIALIALVSYGSGKLSGSIKQGGQFFVMTKKTLEYSLTASENIHRPLLASVIGAFTTNKNEVESSMDQKKAESIPVLLYHGIVEKEDRFSITPEKFLEHMTAIHSAGYETISIEQFSDFMLGKISLKGKQVLVVFDDGRKDSYYNAQPVLKMLGYQATMFIASEASLPSDEKKKPSTYYLSENELKKMIDSGVWSVQSHAAQKTGGIISVDEKGTQGNFLSNKMWLHDESRVENNEEYTARVLWELSNSKKVLEEKLGKPVFAFAYPFGDYGQQQINNPDAQTIIAKSLKEAGYNFAFRQIWENDTDYSHNYPSDPAYLLKRIEPSPAWSGTELVERLEAGEEQSLPYESNTFRPFDWRSSWGTIKINANNELSISASNISTGALAFLDGTFTWADYVFSAELNWNKGSHVSLLSRVKDNENYVACVFNDKGLRIEQYLGGKKRIMAEKDTFFEMPLNDVHLGVAVNGDRVECLVNGNSVIYTYYLSPTLLHGGIGIKTWDFEINNSEITIKKIDVVKIVSDGNGTLAQLPKTELILKKAPQKNETVVAPQKTEQIKIVDQKPVHTPSVKPTATSTIPSIALTDISGVNTPYVVNDFSKIFDAWVLLSGAYFIKDSALHLTSNASTTAGFAVLGSTLDWTDYQLKTKVDWNKGSTLTLIARYKDSKNYMSCTFSYYGLYATMYETVNGKTKTLGKTGKMPTPYYTPWLDVSLGVSVKGDNIACLVNNQSVLRYTRSNMSKSGGIGFKTWDTQKNNSEVTIKEISVEQI